MKTQLLAAILYIFSPDASTVGSSPRELPSQGRSLETGNVVVGLHAVPGFKRAECGWYEVVANPPQTHSNEFARVTGYVFDRLGGTATVQYEIDWKKKAPRTFSKMKCVAALTEAGLWPQVKAWIEGAGLYDLYLAAQDFAEDNEHFKVAVETLKTEFGLTAEQIEAVLKEAEL